MCSEYNGWVNWETWNMALWLGESDEESILDQAHREIEDFTEETTAEETTVNISGASHSLAEWLRVYCEEVYLGHLSREDLRGPAGDAIWSSYWPKIEWYDIANNYIKEAILS